MKHWIVQFLANDGPAMMNAVFRTEGAARKAFEFVNEQADLVRFRDDFGVEFQFDPRAFAVLLTNTEIAAALQRAMSEAQQDAAQMYGLSAMTRPPGSTMQ